MSGLEPGTLSSESRTLPLHHTTPPMMVVELNVSRPPPQAWQRLRSTRSALAGSGSWGAGERLTPMPAMSLNTDDTSELTHLTLEKEEGPANLYETYVMPCLAEFVGLLIFVFIGTMVTGYSASAGSLWLLGVALAHGLTIALLIIAIGHIRRLTQSGGPTHHRAAHRRHRKHQTDQSSRPVTLVFLRTDPVRLVTGGHLNPAVTLGVTLAGGVNVLQGVCYVISQLLGGMVGAAFTKAILPNGTYAGCSGGAHALGGGVSVPGAVLCETLLTMILVLTVLLAAVDSATSGSALPPLAIGLAVLVGILAGHAQARSWIAHAYPEPSFIRSHAQARSWIAHAYPEPSFIRSHAQALSWIVPAGPFSGASMNPARAFGPAVAAGVWDYHYVWWVGPTFGALLAGLIYRAFLASADRRLIAGNRKKRY
ncbi:Aquaporin-8 [Branchiostoma belcheri]|nr:Aquaporin-8 [Branchiostoma belcheri]